MALTQQVVFGQAPGGVTGALLWLQGSTGVYSDAGGLIASTDGGVVQLWKDNSGNGNDVIQTTTSMQPRLQSSAATSMINFYPGVNFSNASASFMGRADILGGSNSQLTTVAVARQNATNIQCGLFRLGNTSGGVYGAFYPGSDNNIYWDLASPGGTARVNTTSGSALSANTPTIGTFINDLIGNRQIASVNGKNVASDATGGAVATNTVEIGHYRNVSTGSFDGMIPEFIIYNTVLTTATQNKVESYLALKYGITLDQSTVHNYTASDGSTVMWNAATASTFNKNIFGIGRDDNSALDQRVSTSSNARGIVTVATTNNFTLANSDASRISLNNLQFLTVSDNSPVSGNPSWTNTAAPTNMNILSSQWMLQNVNAAREIYLQFDVANINYDIPALTTGNVYYLIYDNSGTISASSNVVALTNTQGNLWSTSSPITFSNAAKFTLATPVAAPGGVSGAALWLRSDAGVGMGTGSNVASWADGSTSVNNAAQATAANQPTFNAGNSADAINYNPSITFGATSTTQMQCANPVFGNGTTYSDVHWFGVLKNTSTTDFDWFFYQGISATFTRVTASWNWVGSSNADYDMGVAGTNRISWNFNANVSNNVPKLLSNNNAVSVANTDGINNALARVDGKTVAFANGFASFTPAAASNMQIGNNTIVAGDSPNSQWDGQLGELVMFNTAVTPAQRNKIESYLAIKYGISLDQTTAQDYTASDGITQMWNSATAGSFNNNIFGIGRDDKSALHQKVAASSNARGIVTIATINDFALANTDVSRTGLPNLQFLTVSDNSPASGNPTWVTTGPATVKNMLSSQWMVQNTGSVGDIYLQFNVGNTNYAVPALTNTTNYYLIYDNSGTLSATSTLVKLTNTSGSLWTTSNPINFNNGAKFTLVEIATQSPGGVGSNLLLWLKADNGVTANSNQVAAWANSANTAMTTEASKTASSHVTLSASGLNFNPTVNFDGSVNEMLFGKYASVPASPNVKSYMFSVAIPTATASGCCNDVYSTGVAGGPGIAFTNPGAGNYWTADAAGSNGTLITANLNEPALVRINYVDDASVLNAITAKNGLAAPASPTGATVWSYTATDGFQVGGRTYGGFTSRIFPGNIAEVIVYNGNFLSAVEINRAESYLALKYGISLDQTAATDYIASDGSTKMWNAATAGAFNQNIFGIGRDDNAALDQKVSASVNPRGITTVALQNDFTSANNAATRTSTFVNDKEFFTVSDNSPATGNPSLGTVSAVISGKQLMNSQWKVQTNIGGGGAVYLQFDVANSNYDVPSPGANTVYYLVYDNGGTISASSNTLTLVNNSGSLWSIASPITLQNGAVFTLAAATAVLLPGAIGPSQSVCPSTTPPNPLVETVAPAGGCAISSYQWESSTDNGASWTNITGANAASYTITTVISTQTLYRRTITDACGNTATSVPDTIYITSAQGDPTVFGNGVWNAYAYDASGASFSSAIYRGYYTEPALSFNSASRWGITTTPSNAAGYQGCAVGADNHWVSYRRTNFTPDIYQLDIAAHDDAVFVFINGKQVFNHNGYGDTHTNIWTGKLGATDKVEFLWREDGGQSYGALNITPVTPNTSITGGAINASQHICLHAVPTSFSNQSLANSVCYVNYQWQYQPGCTGAWIDIPGATDSVYAFPNALDSTTCFRRVATNACDVTDYSNTVTVDVGPLLTTNSDTTVCTGNKVILSASTNGSSIMWQGLGSNSSYVVRPTANTSYSATAGDAYGCQITKTVNIAIDSIHASLTAFPQPAKAANDITLTASGSVTYSVLAWTPAALFSNQTANTQKLMILDTSIYSVVIKSQFGCRDTAYLKIIPEPNDRDFFIPNAFTPDGDGWNDVFKAYGRSITEIELRVFNQWGQLLFETKDLNTGWNGYYKGSLQPTGMYIYTVHVKLYSGTTFSKKGAFSLIK